MIASSAPPLARETFAVEPGLVYLNHAAVGVLPVRARDAVVAAVNAHAARGVVGMWPVERLVPQARERLGSLIGARGEDIAFLRSTSDGANTIARGLDWQPGDEIILSDDEFGANAYPWLALRECGVNVRFVETARQRLEPAVLASVMTARTKLVAVSWVAFADGYRHDLAGLSAVTHAGGALFCVDAIQALGAMTLDVRALGIDALYAGGAKWLMALQGVAFLYVSPELRDRLKVRWHGWKAVEDMWDFLNYDQPLAASSARYEAGTQNFLGVLSLEHSVGVLQEAGLEAISDHVIALADRLDARLRSAGAGVALERRPESSAGIVTFTMPGCDPLTLGARLGEQRFVTTYRPNGIRVSPHGHNTAAEIDAFVEAVAALSKRA